MNPPVECFNDVVVKPLTDPLTHQEDKLATCLVRRKLAQVSEDGLVQFKTGGQVHKIIIAHNYILFWW